MLWLCIHLPALPLEALSPPADEPAGIFETAHAGPLTPPIAPRSALPSPAARERGEGRWQSHRSSSSHRRVLIALNEPARKRGLHSGMGVNAALGLVPEVRLLQRDAEAELHGLHSIACWAYTLGTPVTLNPAALDVWVEVHRSLRLFGGLDALRRHIAAQAQGLPYTRAYGLAPTLAAASLLAHAGASSLHIDWDGRHRSKASTSSSGDSEPSGLSRTHLASLGHRVEAGLEASIAKPYEIPAAIGAWPLQLLPLPPAAIATLHGAGLRRIGEVLKIPPDALGRRFGAEVPLLLARLLGRAKEAWESFEPPPIYRRRLELHGGAETAEALLFPLRKMFGDFALYLRGRDVAVQRFRLRLRDLGRHRSQLDIGLLTPTRDPQRLLLVLRERLEKMALKEPVLELYLEARRFEPASAAQDDLFQTGSSSAESFETLHERLVARLGRDAVRSLATTPDHRPERAWIAVGEETRHAAAGSLHPPRPAWLLPQPRSIAAPRLLGPPERIESGWWEGRHERRDYHLAEDESGRKLWVYRELGQALAESQWRLHGLWQ